MILGAQLSVCVFLFSVILQFSKNNLFQKRGAKIGFFNSQCFKLFFWKFSFLGLLKHYKIGVSAIFGFFVVEREENRQKNDNWNLWIWFFGPKMAVSWRTSAFQKKKKGPETPIFIVFFGCAFSGPRCQETEILKNQQEKWKHLTDNWKANFWVFLLFYLFFFLFFLFFFYFFWFF